MAGKWGDLIWHIFVLSQKVHAPDVFTSDMTLTGQKWPVMQQILLKDTLLNASWLSAINEVAIQTTYL